MTKRLGKRIKRTVTWFTCTALVLGAFAALAPPGIASAAEAGPEPGDGWHMLIDDGFDEAAEGTNAETLGYTVFKPMRESGNSGGLEGDAYVVPTPNGAGNSLYMYDNHRSVGDAIYRNHTRIVKTFAPQEGIVIAEVSFMQPGPQRETAKVLNLLSDKGDYIARITADAGTGNFVFDAKTGPDNIAPYRLNEWYDIKVVVDIVNDQVMVYVDGRLSMSRNAIVEVRSEGNTTSEKIRQNIAMLELLTAGGSPNAVSGMYVDNIKVYAKPAAASPAPPTGIVTYPRDGEIYVEWTPEPSARSYNVYVAERPDADDSEYVKVANKYNKKYVPKDYVSFNKLGTSSSSPPIQNGKTYYVKVTQNTRLLSTGTDSEVESALSLSQPVTVTPAAFQPLPGAAQSVIENVYVYDSKHAADWSIQRNLGTGSAPYGDAQDTIASLPSAYEGADWIRTADASAGYTASASLASFSVAGSADVIVAVSKSTLEGNRAWLSSWTRTGETIALAGDAETYELYKKPFPAGSEVALGRIGQADARGYFVIVKERSLLSSPLIFTDADGRKVTQLIPGTETSARAELLNDTAEEQPVVLIVALYDEQQRMVDYSSASVRMAPGGRTTLHAGIKLPDNAAGYRLKAFLWDGWDTMRPLSDAIELE